MSSRKPPPLCPGRQEQTMVFCCLQCITLPVQSPVLHQTPTVYLVYWYSFPADLLGQFFLIVYLKKEILSDLEKQLKKIWEDDLTVPVSTKMVTNSRWTCTPFLRLIPWLCLAYILQTSLFESISSTLPGRTEVIYQNILLHSCSPACEVRWPTPDLS